MPQTTTHKVVTQYIFVSLATPQSSDNEYRRTLTTTAEEWREIWSVICKTQVTNAWAEVLCNLWIDIYAKVLCDSRNLNTNINQTMRKKEFSAELLVNQRDRRISVQESKRELALQVTEEMEDKAVNISHPTPLIPGPHGSKPKMPQDQNIHP